MEIATIDSLTGGLTFTPSPPVHTLQDMHKTLSKPIEGTQELLSAHRDLNNHFDPKPSKLSVEERVKLAMQVGEEVTTEEELRELFSRKEVAVCYDGFEPSGRMHIAQGVFKMINVNRLTECGCVFVFWVADWFAKLNNKMGGDLERIRLVGHYFVEVWKALGMKLDNVKFLWCSDEIMKDPETYWGTVMDVATRNSVTRIKRCATIMGRKEEEDLSVAQCLYPCMQCTDIFYLGTDICQLGMDQRKVNVLAREWAGQVKVNKPIIMSHHMLLGLIEGQEKMSKSNPDSAIFMEDSEDDVNRKMKKAFCPPGKVYNEEGKIINPCMDYLKNIVFGARKEVEIQRKPEFGGNIVYKSYQEAEVDYLAEKLHPGDLKPMLAKVINELIQPVRDHFKNDPFARQLLEVIRTFTITR